MPTCVHARVLVPVDLEVHLHGSEGPLADQMGVGDTHLEAAEHIMSALNPQMHLQG